MRKAILGLLVLTIVSSVQSASLIQALKGASTPSNRQAHQPWAAPGTPITVIVINQGGIPQPYTILNSSTVSDLKDLIQIIQGLAPGQVRLIFNNNVLTDNVSLFAQGVETGSQLHIVLRMRGGR